jgi:NAD(P)-dependent dehydrogenase (short-subunit alcohol dehydrogenase family)
MLLENKNAIIYGGGGAIGGGVARTFAREGARVFLAGRTASRSMRSPRTSVPRAGRRRWTNSMPSTSKPSTSTPGP